MNKLSIDEKVNLYKEGKYQPTGVDYEHYIAEQLNKIGYYAYVTKATGDQGADVVIKLNNYLSIIIQCKYYSNAVDNSPVQEISGALKYYNAQMAMAMTNNRFTRHAQTLAIVNNIMLIDNFDFGDDIFRLINALGLYPKKYFDSVALEINDLKYDNQELRNLLNNTNV